MRLTVLLLLCALSSIRAEETQQSKSTEDGEGIETTVRSKRPITAASSTTVRDRDLKLRPARRPSDVIAVTPGLFVVQHAGGGKANQYFLRGYDADHGTDVALYVDDVPVNLVSHGHGQGYSDLHFVITELVDRVDVLKGPYFSHLGDFATAGGIRLYTYQTLPTNQAKLSAGMFSTARLLAVGSDATSAWKPLVAVEGYYTNGPFLFPEATRRFNVFAKATRNLTSESELTLGLTAYGGKWRASGQIPQREVLAGRLDRFGVLDDTEGGNSNRYSLTAAYRNRLSPNDRLTISSWIAYSNLSLFSNFTFFSADSVNGDQINQRDNRVFFGWDASYQNQSKLGEAPLTTTVGLQGRRDAVTNALRNTVARQYLGSVKENDVKEFSLSAYVNEDAAWNSWFRSVVGVRADLFFFNATDLTTGTPMGSSTPGVILPKASLIFSPLDKTDFYVNYGMGFHSNDARGVLDPASPAKALSRVYGYEVGARTRLWDDRLDLAVAGFLQNSDGELVYVGDDGGTENKGPSRRFGVELEARVKLLDWLYADADLSLTRAKLRGAAAGSDEVPYAPRRLITAGLSAQHEHGYFGRLGIFSIGDRPATEDSFLTAEGFTRLDLTIGYRQRSYELTLSVQNALDTKWREAQFATVSRLPSETSAASCPAGTRPQNDDLGAFAGCEDIHFTPGAPINVQASAAYFF